MLGFDRRAAKAVWTAALVLLLLAAVYFTRHTLFIVLMAVFFSYMLYPVVRWVAAHTPKRVTRTTATAIVFVLVVLALVAVGVVVGPLLSEQAQALGTALPTMLKDTHWVDRIPLPAALEPVRQRIAEFVRDQLAIGGAAAVPTAKRVGQIALGVVGSSLFVVVVPILSFLMIKDAAELRARAQAFLDRGDHGAMWRRIVDGLHGLLGSYIRALLILSSATAIVYGVAFSLFGLKYALVLAVVAGALEVIPVVGPLVAAAASVVVALLTGFEHTLWLIGFIAAYRVFQDYVLNPYLMGSGVEIPPLLVLLGLLAGEEVGGVPGIFLSVPVIAAAKVVIAEIAAEVGERRSGRRRDAAGGPDATPSVAAAAGRPVPLDAPAATRGSDPLFAGEGTPAPAVPPAGT